MKTRIILFISLFCSLKLIAQKHTTAMPRLVKQGSLVQLFVDNKPYLALGGELGNSSASNLAYMKPYWAKLDKMHLNTLIVPVYWELMEPAEGKFDFALLDKLIENGRRHHLKFVLLWFGAWKNSMSCYAPLWVKINEGRFPRAVDTFGVKHEILTSFSANNLQADKKAFVALMHHLKLTDGTQHTVIMVQVENEIGMLPSARDYYKGANQAFNSPVPAELVNYLEKNKNSLLPEIKSKWEAGGFKITGTWEEIFGKNMGTEEIFMAWHFSKYVNEVAQAGKQAYDLPMYVNAALNRPNKKPGEYPSAGPLPHLMDIWKAGAPNIDILSPDVYFPDIKHWADLFTRASNPLFIPEAAFEDGVEAKAFYVIGHYNAIGFSPFSIESVKNAADAPLGKSYDIIDQLAPLILNYQRKGMVEGVLLGNAADSAQLNMGGYILTVKHDFTLGWSPHSKDAVWPLTGGIVICTGPGEFFVGGTGIVITFKPVAQGLKAGIASSDEGRFIQGKWVAGRRMNGDQDHQGRHIRIETNEFGIQHVTLYTY